MNFKNICILIVIFLIALFLRFYKIDSVNCLNLDEAAFGYNAYSLLLTGKDEYGTRYPLEFTKAGFEAGISSFLVCVAILTFILATKGKKYFYLVSFSLFVLSMYAY